MPIFQPHGPIHEETEFWYDTREKALLYEVRITSSRGNAEADHHRSRERGHLTNIERFDHDHYQPHGITFGVPKLYEPQGAANIENTELVIRLWCQIENGDQPNRTRRREPLLPVPKPLALFLSARRLEMHRPDSLTQALLLLQSYILCKDSQNCPSQT